MGSGRLCAIGREVLAKLDLQMQPAAERVVTTGTRTASPFLDKSTSAFVGTWRGGGTG